MPRHTDTEIYSYFLKSGKKKYGFKTYIGTDRETGQAVKVTRQGFKSRKEAEQAKILIKAQGASKVKHRQQAGKNKKTVDQVWQAWLPIYRASVKGSSVSRMKSSYKHAIYPSFGKDYINLISIEHLQDFADKMAQEYVMFERNIALLHRLIKFAIMRGWCDNDPFVKVIIPKKSAKKSKDESHNFYELSELKQFLAAAKKHNYRYYAFFMVLASLGLRRGEALALKWHDIDFKNKTVKIAHTITRDENNKKIYGSPKTPSSKRELMLPNNLIKVLTKYKQKLPDHKSQNDFVFHQTNGSFLSPSVPYDWIQSVYKSEPNLRQITPHGFRHTLATLLYDGDKRITPKDVQAILGHKKVTTALNIYTHVTAKQKKNVTESINNLDL